jgi:hypothetical protein
MPLPLGSYLQLLSAAAALASVWSSAAAQPCPDPEGGPRAGGQLSLSAGFSDDMVLQRAPAKAAVYGFAGAGPVSVRVTGTDGAGAAVEYVVAAQPRADGTFKAFLSPHVAGGSFTLTATAAASGSSVVLRRITFGDIYVCSGQVSRASRECVLVDSKTWFSASEQHGIGNLLHFLGRPPQGGGAERWQVRQASAVRVRWDGVQLQPRVLATDLGDHHELRGRVPALQVVRPQGGSDRPLSAASGGNDVGAAALLRHMPVFWCGAARSSRSRSTA